MISTPKIVEPIIIKIHELYPDGFYKEVWMKYRGQKSKIFFDPEVCNNRADLEQYLPINDSGNPASLNQFHGMSQEKRLKQVRQYLDDKNQEYQNEKAELEKQYGEFMSKKGRGVE